MNDITPARSQGARTVLAAAACTFLLAGCATTAPQGTVSDLGGAESAVTQAESEGAATHAPVEIAQARKKLERAEAAMAEERFEQADRLAAEAQLDAQLAEYKAQTAEAEKALTEINETIDTLRAEIGRASQ